MQHPFLEFGIIKTQNGHVNAPTIAKQSKLARPPLEKVGGYSQSTKVSSNMEPAAQKMRATGCLSASYYLITMAFAYEQHVQTLFLGLWHCNVQSPEGNATK